MTDNRMQVNEAVRRVVSKDGHTQVLTGVKTVDNSGSWLRMETDQGFVLVNSANVLMYIIKSNNKADV